MAKEIVMPRLSDTMEEGKILKWHKQVGDEVKKGDVLAEIETDKANMELESYDDGFLTRILIEEGGQAPLGIPIAEIGAQGEIGSSASSEVKTASVAPPAVQPKVGGDSSGVSEAPAVTAPGTETPRAEETQPSAVAAPSDDSDARVKASPLAKKIAEEKGIDLRQVKGTGPGGRIVRDDVESFAPSGATQAAIASATEARAESPKADQAATPAPKAEAPKGEVVQLSRMQQTIAKRMAESKRQVPHFYVTTEIDTAELTELRKKLNGSGESVKLSYNDFVVKAVALALTDMPLVNSSWKDETVYSNPQINIGVAVTVPNGLLVPVIHDAGNKSLRQIAEIGKGIYERTRENRLKSEDVSGATFTISNLGMFDVDQFNAIVDQPSVAILAVGSIKQKPVVVNNEIVVGERMKVTISCDHRVVYGAEAAQFLQLVKRRIESPYSLLG